MAASVDLDTWTVLAAAGIGAVGGVVGALAVVVGGMLERRWSRREARRAERYKAYDTFLTAHDPWQRYIYERFQLLGGVLVDSADRAEPPSLDLIAEIHIARAHVVTLGHRNVALRALDLNQVVIEAVKVMRHGQPEEDMERLARACKDLHDELLKAIRLDPKPRWWQQVNSDAPDILRR